MSFKGTAPAAGQNGNGEPREVPPAGNVPAVLIGIVDLGTREESFNNESKKTHHLFLVFELTGEPLSAKPDRNHVVGQRYTFSFHEKSNLRQLYEKWLGRKFAEGEPIDYAAKLAHPCLVTLNHGVSAKGMTYAKVTGFGPLVRGMESSILPPKHQPFLYSLGDGLLLRNKQTKQMEIAGSDLPDWDWLPFVYGKSVNECLAESDECKALMGGTSRTPARQVAVGDDSPF